MNKKPQKNVTKHKGSKVKTDNDDAEVFVLPPNLLEQLGINLNIGSTSESTKDSQGTDINIPPKEKGEIVNKLTPTNNSQNPVSACAEIHSSIIETAELTKKSIFLSPTFISNNTNAIQGEIEIIGNAGCEKCHEKINFDLENNGHSKFKNSEEVQKLSVTRSPQETKEWDKAAHNNVEIHDIEMQTLIDDHADEAYSSDCSNSNIGCPVTTEFKKSNANKINIISEQIILPSQIYNYEGNYKLQENNLVHVSIDTVITSHKKDVVHSPKISMDVIPNLIVNKQRTETDINECTFMYKPHCVNENNDISTLDSDTMQNIDKITVCGELNETVSDFIITPYNPEQLQQDNVILQTSPEINAILKSNVAVSTGITIPWHVDTDEESKYVDKRTNEIGNEMITVRHDERNKDNEVDSSKVIITDSYLARNVDCNTMRITSCESKSEMFEDDITVIRPSYVSDDNESIKYPSPENVVLQMYQTPDATIKDNVTVDTSLTIPWHVETDDVSKIMNTKGKETNIQTCNEYNDVEGIETFEVVTTTDLNKDVPPRKNNFQQTFSTAETQNHNSVKKTKRSSDTSQMKRTKQCDKNIHASDPILEISSQSKTLKADSYIKQTLGKKESDDGNFYHEEIHECESNWKRTINENGSCGSTNVYKDSIRLDDKIREIAEYLSKYADLKKRTNMNAKQIVDNTFSNKKHAAFSKSSKHGVEKPGGSGINNEPNKRYPPINTYERKRKDSCRPVPSLPSHAFKASNTCAQSINSTDISSSSNTCNKMEFCLCHDFGRLLSYDNETSYEHIHFWNNTGTDCTPDVIYSIYNDDTYALILDNNIQDDKNEHLSEDSVTSVRKLCWNELNFLDKDRLDDVHDLDFNVKRKECNYFQEKGENLSSKVNRENKCNENEEAKNESECKNKVTTVNLLQNGEITPNNKVVVDEQSNRTGRKRKGSMHTNNDGPPVKKYGRISKQLSATDNCDRTVKYRTTSNNEKECSSDTISEVYIENFYVKKEQEPAEPDDSELIKCGVCAESMQNLDWDDHIATRHNYLAWKVGEPSLDVNDEKVVREHLYQITKANGGLICAKCGVIRKYVKAYLSHIRSCSGLDESQNNSTSDNLESEVIPEEKSTNANSNDISHNDAAPANTDVIKCGVCGENVQMEDWNDHRASRHDYIAWIHGDSPLDVKDETAVREHLYVILKAYGGLTCAKCGITRKYVKSYLSHITSCNGLSESQNDSAYNISTDIATAMVEQASNSITDPIDEEQNASMNNKLVECGVCEKILLDKDWFDHIASQHDYMAWKLGEPTLDANDEEAVRQHLYDITKACGGLTCSKCWLTRKYVKSYLTHFKYCRGPNDVNHKSASVNSRLEQTISTEVTPSASAELVKCGVCGQYMQSNDWAKHIATIHEYLAWREGETPFNVNDEQETCLHLQNVIKEIGPLACLKCGFQQEYVKPYLHHKSICDNEQVCIPLENIDNDPDQHEKPNDSKTVESNSFKCGVCNEIVDSSSWPKHLSEEHNYLAWKDSDTPLDLNDEDEVYRHLYDCAKEFGSLVCKHCGKCRKFVKAYLNHMKTCNQDVTEKVEPATDVSNSTLDLDEPVVDFTSGGTCAVCHKEVEAGQWIQHTQKEHNYLAWREGEKPWDLDDFADVNRYLYVINKKMDGLTCNKCGLVRKYVKTYMTHIKNCNVTDLNHDLTVSEGTDPVIMNKEMYQCAMCKEMIKAAKWNSHALEKHYNVTWIIGQTPIDIKNPYVVERYIKEYKRVCGKLKCRTCGATRASCSGFYAHVITCGKTEEEIDMFKEVCEICNNKYLCIYRNQHAMGHKVQSYSAELKLKKETIKKEEAAPLDTSGKRRAAVKARSVIENYSNNMSKHLHTCHSCGFGTDFKAELKKHKCQTSNEKDFSGDESSAAEIESSDESPDSDVDSNISNEVNDDDDEDDEPLEPKKILRYRETAPVVSKVLRIPFEVGDPSSYIKQGDIEYCNTHLSDDELFPLWRCEPETVPESELSRYLPPLERSCQLKSSAGWITLFRFASRKDANGTSIFVGASIVCVAWAPLRVEHIISGGSNFLAIACHNGADCPRYQGDETPRHENIIQIWNFSTFKELPELSFGIAHEFGTVWSMDWCPSGARDPEPGDTEMSTARLGLLAVACSSGTAYIFAVPYPSTDEKKNPLIHKFKPVAELRMTTSSDRKRYQATSVSWSKQKGHNIVLVGYADGSTAYYDLNSTSPLLRTTEDDVQVFYPYHDERAHNTCITGTDLYPVAGLETAGAGACACSAPTGAHMTARAGAGAGAGGAGGRAALPVAALGIVFAPHAASAVLTGDDAIMHTTRSELVWVQPGRRLGSVRSAAGCARCGRVAASMPPTLRVMRPHPAYTDPKKVVVGMLQMTRLTKKRKQVNDELAMTVEPLTYKDAVRKYGIEFQKISKIDRATQQQLAAKPKSHFPERFPLADVKSLAFCPSRKYHDRLAVATHSGILFLMSID